MKVAANRMADSEPRAGSDTTNDQPALLRLPFEIRRMIWKFCPLEPISLKTRTTRAHPGTHLETIRDVNDLSLIPIPLSISPLLFLNRQINDEARAIVRQKVTLYCPHGFPKTERERLLGLSNRQRGFVDEIRVSMCLREHQLRDVMGKYSRDTAAMLETMWNRVVVGDQVVKGASLHRGTGHTLVTWTVVVGDAKILSCCVSDGDAMHEGS